MTKPNSNTSEIHIEIKPQLGVLGRNAARNLLWLHVVAKMGFSFGSPVFGDDAESADLGYHSRVQGYLGTYLHSPQKLTSKVDK